MISIKNGIISINGTPTANPELIGLAMLDFAEATENETFETVLKEKDVFCYKTETKISQNIPQNQTATGLPASTSLDGCPFHYCDKNPNCSGRCRYHN